MRRLARFVMPVALLAAASCVDFIQPPTSALGISGTYALRAVNGINVPGTIGLAILDSGSFEVRSKDTVVFRDTYHTPGATGQAATVTTSVGYYLLDKAESGTIYGIDISPLPSFTSPVFTTHGDSVFMQSATATQITTRVYSR